VIPKGSLFLMLRSSLIVIDVPSCEKMIRAMLPALDCVNHRAPLGAAAMSSGSAPKESGNSLTWFVSGSRYPTALLKRSVNHAFPSEAMEIWRGIFFWGVSLALRPCRFDL
jgi:hypothetical protein